METRHSGSNESGEAHVEAEVGHVTAPADLDAQLFTLGSDEFAVLSFPLPIGQAEIMGSAHLTPSEREVCALVLAGHSNSEIARIRGTSPRTIANQIACIYRRLGLRSRRELLASRSPFGQDV